MDDEAGGLIRDLRTLFDLGMPGALSDGQLLDRFVDHGDAEALGALVRRHGPMVLGVCRRILREEHDAEDAFQATFLVLTRRAPSIVPREKVGLWLHGVARRTALKAGASRARMRRRECPMPDVPAPRVARPETADERLGDLDRELGRLPEKYRVPIVLCELEGQTHRQAAEQLGWPIGTVSGRLSRGRALLARRLSRRRPAPSALPLEALLARELAPASIPSSVLSSTLRAVAAGAAARSPAAGLVSPEVAALSEGVIKTMMLTGLKTAAIPVALALGLCGIAGAVVVIGQDDKHPARTAPATAIARDEGKQAAGQAGATRAADATAALLRDRDALARKGYEAALQALSRTQRQGDVLIVLGKPEEVYRWSIRRLEVEREQNPQPAGRRAALESHLRRIIDLDKLMEQRVKTLVPETMKFETEWYVLEARHWLEQAKE